MCICFPLTPAENGRRHASGAVEYLKKIQRALSNMDTDIACALGGIPETEPVEEPAEDVQESLDAAWLLDRIENNC